MDAPPEEATTSSPQKVRVIRIVALVSSSALSIAATYLALEVPSRYYLSASYDPSATWQAKASAALIAVSTVALVIGFVGTVRWNSARENEPGYSTWGALLSTVPPIFLLALSMVARLNAG